MEVLKCDATFVGELDLHRRFHKLLNEGKKVQSTSSLIDINLKPIYLIEKRFEQAKKTCQKYYSNISMASTTGLLILVQIESIVLPLLKTRKSHSVPDLLDRYMETARYMRKFYETTFYESDTEAWSYIKLVREMHIRIHKLMNELALTDRKFELSESLVWVNQYDMAITQFAFIGLFVLHPEKCGAYYVTREEMTDIIYFWRTLSYYFGIEEQFNIFIFHDDLDKQLSYMRVILEHMNQLIDESRNKVGLEMAKGIMLAFEDLCTNLSFNILDHYWSPVIAISDQAGQAPYTLLDLWKLISFALTFRFLFRIEKLLGFFNTKYKEKFDKFCESRDKIKQNLTKKYGHLTYELER